MAKGQKRSNKEARKPKLARAKPTVATALFKSASAPSGGRR
jgi:hypothetical protein